MPGTSTKKAGVSVGKEAVAEKEAPKGNPGWVRNEAIEQLAVFQNWFMYNLPPKNGPRMGFHCVVDLNKGTMMFVIFAMMLYFDNFSLGAWVYLSLHGSYGFFWAIKSAAFPDAGLTAPATITSCFLAPGPVALIPYYFIAYWAIQGLDDAQRNPSYERIFVACQVHVYGCVLTMVTDVQKHLVLRERRGLITHGMMGWSRNLNYIGEILIYASFGIMCQRWEAWAIYSFNWGVIFVLRMILKDYSNSKKAGWPEYAAKTWFFLPKLYNNALLSYVVYTLFFGSCFYMYTHGGIEATAKAILNK